MTPSCSGSSSGACTEHAVSNWSILGKSAVSFVSLVPAILVDISSWSLCLFSGIFFTLHLINHCLPRIINTTTTIITTITHTPRDDQAMVPAGWSYHAGFSLPTVSNLYTSLCRLILSMFSRSWGNLALFKTGNFSASGSHRPAHLLEETFERARKESLVSNSSSAW